MQTSPCPSLSPCSISMQDSHNDHHRRTPGPFWSISRNFRRICGVFNIHVCCAANALAKDFLNLMSSLNFVQQVKGPTHCLGHTLDLTLTYSLSVADVEFCDVIFSDHILVLFTTLLPPLPSMTPNQVCWSHILTAQSCTDSSNMYLQVHQPFILDPITSHSSVDGQVKIFNNRCSNILDLTAPRKHIHLK